MPISPDALSHAYLVRPAHESLHTTLHVWRDTLNSQESWWLIIQHDDGRYTAARFADLRMMLPHPDLTVHMNTFLAELPARADDGSRPGVVAPLIADMAATDAARAEGLRDQSPGGVLIVMEDGAFKGILSQAMPAPASVSRSLRDILAAYDRLGNDDTVILPPNRRPANPNLEDTIMGDDTE